MGYSSNPLSPSRAASFACTSGDPRTRRTTDGDREVLPLDTILSDWPSQRQWILARKNRMSDSLGARDYLVTARMAKTPMAPAPRAKAIKRKKSILSVLMFSLLMCRVFEHSSCPSHMGVL
jgi:hypothetical protein